MTIQFSKPGKFTISTPANGNGWTTETIDVAASATSYDEDPFVTESAPSAQIAPRTAPDVSTPPAKASAPPAVPKAPTSSEPVKRSPSTQVAHPPDPQIKRQQPAVPNVEIPNVATPSIKDLPLVEKTPVPNSAVSKEDAPLVRRPAPTPKDLDDGASPMPSPAITKSSETILDMEAKLTQTQKEFLEKKKNAGSVKDLEADAEAYKKVLLDLQKTVGKENKQLDGNLAKVEQLLTVIASWKEYFREATEDAEKFRQPYLDAYAEYTKVENGPDKSAKRDVAMNASEKYYEALAKEQELKNGWSIQLEGDMGISRTLTYTNAQRVEDNKKQIFANTMTVELGKLKVAEEKSQMKKGVPLPPDIRPPTGQKVGPEKTPVVPLVTAPAAPLREGVKEPVLSAAKAPANSKKTLPTPTDATPVVPESVPVAIPSVPTTPQAASPVTSESPQEESKEDAKAAYESKIKELRSSSDSLNNFYNAADDELIKQDYIAAIQKEIAAIIEGKPVWEEDEALNKTEGERLLRLESEFKRLTKVEKREKVSEVERSELSVVVLNAFESKLLSRSKATVLSKDEADALYEATYSAVANHIPMSNSMINLARTVRKFEPIHPALVMLNPQWNGMGWILKSTTSKSQEVLLQDAERTLAKALDSKQVTDADMKEYMMKMYKVDDAAATLLLTEVKSFLPNAPKVASKPLTDTLKDLEEELPGK